MAFQNSDTKMIMDTIGKVNTMISSVNVDCVPGSQCDTDKTRDELLKIYNDAKRTAATAPTNLDTSRENYYKFVLGDGYTEFHEKEVEKKASIFISDKTNLFFKALNTSVVTLEDYIKELNSIKYAKTLDKLVEGFESADLSKTLDVYLKDTSNTSNINERKVFYEQENYESLLWWYNVWFYIYLFLLIVLIISIFMINNQKTFMTNMGIFVLFVAYIFLAKPLLFLIVYIIKQLGSLLPKNVYLSLNS